VSKRVESERNQSRRITLDRKFSINLPASDEQVLPNFTCTRANRTIEDHNGIKELYLLGCSIEAGLAIKS
jgi:hypothetical protein